MTLVIDGNILLMAAVFVWRKTKKIPITYFFCLQLFKYVKLYKPDKIYIAADHGSSWRKEIYSEYKANRKPFRESFPDIDWTDVFDSYNELLENMQLHTPVNVIQIKNIEGDDIISYLCRYNKDETMIITKDEDLKQLLVLPHVSIGIPNKGKIKEFNSPEKDVVEDKIKNGDKSDNISKANSFSEMVRNQVLVDLLNLPNIIDSTIRTFIDSVKKNPEDGTFQKIYKFKFLSKVYNLLKGGQDG